MCHALGSPGHAGAGQGLMSISDDKISPPKPTKNHRCERVVDSWYNVADAKGVPPAHAGNRGYRPKGSDRALPCFAGPVRPPFGWLFLLSGYVWVEFDALFVLV